MDPAKVILVLILMMDWPGVAINSSTYGRLIPTGRQSRKEVIEILGVQSGDYRIFPAPREKHADAFALIGLHLGDDKYEYWISDFARIGVMFNKSGKVISVCLQKNDESRRMPLHKAVQFRLLKFLQ